jgi:hypothetical protein
MYLKSVIPVKQPERVVHGVSRLPVPWSRAAQVIWRTDGASDRYPE